jgi:hypothetical protein
VYRANQSAEQLLVGDVQIIHIQRKLVSKDTTATASFDQALYELLWQRTGPGTTAPVVLPRRGGYPLLAYPMRIAGLNENPLADCQAIVIPVDIGTKHVSRKFSGGPSI